MKLCPKCGRDYNDDSLSFCLDDGSGLLFGPGADEPKTAIISDFRVPPPGGFAHDTKTQVFEAPQTNDDPQSAIRYVRSYYLASIYAALGDKDNAFAELERSLEERDCYLGRVPVDPLMDPLRDHARFKEVLKRMGLH